MTDTPEPKTMNPLLFSVIMAGVFALISFAAFYLSVMT